MPRSRRLAPVKSATGYQPIDWTAVDPDDPGPELVKRYQNLLAAKRWAKKPLSEPLDEATTVAYIAHTRDKQLERLNASATKATLAKEASKTVADGLKSALDERIDGYLRLIFEPQPQDVVSLRQLCSIELRMEQIQESIDLTPPSSEETLKMRAMMTAEWKDLVVQYREFAKSLNLTKSQRDANRADKSPSDLFMEEMEKGALWMESELHILTCSFCATEVLWLWWAFWRVHNPRPFYFTGRCACGQRIELGNLEEVLKAA